MIFYATVTDAKFGVGVFDAVVALVIIQHIKCSFSEKRRGSEKNSGMLFYNVFFIIKDAQ